jgi:hypothetical protein
VTSKVLSPLLATVVDPCEGMSGEAGPTPYPNPCDAKDCGDRAESFESLEA